MISTFRVTACITGRTIAEFVQKASEFETSCYLFKEGRRVNVKSLLGVMSLNIQRGDHLEIETVDENFRKMVRDTLGSQEKG